MGKGLSWIERKGVKVGWAMLSKRYPAIRTWSPIIGGAVLIVVTILHFAGQHDAAGTLLQIAGLVGLTEASPVTLGELKEFGAVLVGAWMLGRGIFSKVWPKLQALLQRVRKAQAATE